MIARTDELSIARSAVPQFERLAWPYRLALPFMYLLAVYTQVKCSVYRGLYEVSPRTNVWLVDGISPSSRRVKEGAARWEALDVVYNYSIAEGQSRIARAIDRFWLNVRNAQAVRNRLAIVRQELWEATLARVRDGEPIRLLSLAAGAAQGVVDTVARAHGQGIRLEVVLVDQDPSALAHARMLAERRGVAPFISTIEGNVLFFDHAIGQFRPDIIEMCGLMDYLRTKTAVSLLRKIHRVLKPGGCFITCHVHPNAEAYFLKWVVAWNMRYRTTGEFEDVLAEGRFLGPRFVEEPHRIHSVAIARKT